MWRLLYLSFRGTLMSTRLLVGSYCSVFIFNVFLCFVYWSLSFGPFSFVAMILSSFLTYLFEYSFVIFQSYFNKLSLLYVFINVKRNIRYSIYCMYLLAYSALHRSFLIQIGMRKKNVRCKDTFQNSASLNLRFHS